MIALIVIGAAAAGVGAAALLGSRQGPPQASPAPSDQGAGPGPAAVAPAQAPQSKPPPADGKAARGLDLGAGGVLAVAGLVGGELAKASAFTNTAKDVAVPVGVGVAAAAYLATQVGGAAVVAATGTAVTGAAAGAILLAPVVLLTVAVVTVVDGIARTVQAGDWAKLATEVARLRSKGQVREALALYEAKASTISEIARVWPQPGDKWFNAADPLGRPYPGFPGPPAAATADEVKRWPGLVPDSVWTTGGREIPVRGLFQALQADVNEVRAYGLSHRAPGVVLTQGKEVQATEGDRDLRGWAPYAAARAALANWATAIAVATPWLTRDALLGGVLKLTATETAVDAARQAAAAKKKDAQATAQVARRTGLSTADARAARKDAAASVTTRQEAAAAKTGGSSTTRASSAAERTTDGRTPPRNNSGSGGRNV